MVRTKWKAITVYAIYFAMAHYFQEEFREYGCYSRIYQHAKIQVNVRSRRMNATCVRNTLLLLDRRIKPLANNVLKSWHREKLDSRNIWRILGATRQNDPSISPTCSLVNALRAFKWISFLLDGPLTRPEYESHVHINKNTLSKGVRI